jgi:hypothetical protein
MKGTIIQKENGWFVDTLVITDRPPFFYTYGVKIELSSSNKPFLKEGAFVEYYVDIFCTPLTTTPYAYITKELFI